MRANCAPVATFACSPALQPTRNNPYHPTHRTT